MVSLTPKLHSWLTLQLHFEMERLWRGATSMWGKKNQPRFPSPESSNPRHTHNGMDGRWVEGKRNKMGPCLVHLRHGPTRPLRSSLWHWDVYSSQSTPSWTKGVHSTRRLNCRAHHQAQTLKWRGPGVYATPCWQRARSPGSAGAVPPYPPPLHLQIDTHRQKLQDRQTKKRQDRMDTCNNNSHCLILQSGWNQPGYRLMQDGGIRQLCILTHGPHMWCFLQCLWTLETNRRNKCISKLYSHYLEEHVLYTNHISQLALMLKGITQLTDCI